MKEAKALSEKIKVLPNCDILGNAKVYVYYLDIKIRNFFILNEKASQEDYTDQLVQIHYLLINLHESILQGNPLQLYI